MSVEDELFGPVWPCCSWLGVLSASEQYGTKPERGWIQKCPEDVEQQDHEIERPGMESNQIDGVEVEVEWKTYLR